MLFFWRKKKEKKHRRGYIRLPNFGFFKRIYLGADKRAQEAAENLIQYSRLKAEYFVMSGLSGVLASLAILLDNTALLIGAMVLAPLLNPVLAFAAGIFLFHKGLFFYALKSFFGGILFVVATSALLVKGLILTNHIVDLTPTIIRFQEYNSYLLIAAFVSGFAGVYSWLRPLNNLNLVGVAIAVSLIPFVSFFGMLLGAEEFYEIKLLALAFVLNLALIIFGAMVAYLVLGFSRVRGELDDSIQHSEK